MAYPVTKEGEGGVHIPYPKISDKDEWYLCLIRGTKKDQKLVDEWNKKRNKN